jgi:DTW domain-containing protein YfiP
MSRSRCPRCLRPERACICAWIAPTANVAEVLVLQHPLEVAQAKGSARLLHLSLQRSRMVTGECFDPSELQGMLADGGLVNILLYPDQTDDTGALASASAPALAPRSANPAQLRLIVLDGTWRKSRKMLSLNPMLQRLPRLALQEPPPSQYLIRKAQRPDQRSTLEATCLALQQLEAAPNERYAPLMSAFDAFVASQVRVTVGSRQPN